MNAIFQTKDFIEIDGEKYYHYAYFGKYIATKFVVINGVHYYNDKKTNKVEFDDEGIPMD
jgi:hypothetical protein